jgi:hypothetical protein
MEAYRCQLVDPRGLSEVFEHGHRVFVSQGSKRAKTSTRRETPRVNGMHADSCPQISQINADELEE